MIVNTNPSTGIRHGLINASTLNSDVLDELWRGDGAVNISERDALEELRREATTRYEAAVQSAENMYIAGQQPWEDFLSEHVERHLRLHHSLPENRHIACDTAEEYADWVTEQECDFNIDEPIIEGTYEGVKYRISWLGGAPILRIIEGPLGYARELCSPCVPNAANLDGGYVLERELDLECLHDTLDRWDYKKGRNETWYGCYVVPEDWLDFDNKALEQQP